MTQPLSPLQPRRLYQQIAQVLVQAIDSGRFPPGSCLPPERELAEQLGVSRTSVREALIALEVEGRVSVRVGFGVLVLAPPAPGSAAAPPQKVPGEAGAEDPVGPMDVLLARLVVEPETAALAAPRVTPADLDTLRGTLDAMAREHRVQSVRHGADRSFHIEIARIAGNAALQQIVTHLWDMRRTRLQQRLEAVFATPERFADTQRDHEAILEALQAHDGAAARLAMRQHLERVRDTLSREIDQAM